MYLRKPRPSARPGPARPGSAAAAPPPGPAPRAPLREPSPAESGRTEPNRLGWSRSRTEPNRTAAEPSRAGLGRAGHAAAAGAGAGAAAARAVGTRRVQDPLHRGRAPPLSAAARPGPARGVRGVRGSALGGGLRDGEGVYPHPGMRGVAGEGVSARRSEGVLARGAICTQGWGCEWLCR